MESGIEYKYATQTNIISGGFINEDVGVVGGDTGWHTSTETHGSASSQYYYTDSDCGDNNNSSRMVVTIEDTWDVTVDKTNTITITVKTRVLSVERTFVRGNPCCFAAQGLFYPRHLWIRQTADSPSFWEKPDDTICDAHMVMGSALSLPSRTFVIGPGDSTPHYTVYYRNSTAGFENDPDPAYHDIYSMGVHFSNSMPEPPKDYRPGQRKIGGRGMSHNRPEGWTERKGYGEMRTNNGHEASDDPPHIKLGGEHLNQLLIGEGGEQ